MALQATVGAIFLNGHLNVKNNELHRLVLGCQQNDRTCQRDLYDHFYGYALSVAAAYSSRLEEAREVVNDAFLKVFAGIGRFEEGLSFTAWLRIIVVRTAINRFHREAKSPVFLDLTECLDASLEDDFLSRMAADDVIALLQKLPPAYRLTINLFALEGYSHPEIAEMLGISVGASKSNLSKARARFKQLMTQFLPEKYG